MYRLILTLILFLIPSGAFAHVSIKCGGPPNDFQCFAATSYFSQHAAAIEATTACTNYFGQLTRYCGGTVYQGDDMCHAAVQYGGQYTAKAAPDPGNARGEAIDFCAQHLDENCHIVLTVCDGTADDKKYARVVTTAPAPRLTWTDYLRPMSPIVNVGAISAGIYFGMGIIIALLAYAKRAALGNFIIHGNLPRSLPVYAEDIGVLFKRSQRVNWYGRIIFGITARLGMTEAQLTLIRRYWLGRVIAFDSLRRQRQNELARMHLQLAASMKAEPKDKKALSQILAFIKTVLLSVFYLLRALFNFLFGFLFIRITIAKLARGKLIESKDLVLALQAKEAIEETARYLKEYLTVAETFDGREELFESK
jgi:hypothetical protein